MSGDKSSAALCRNCNLADHNSSGFTEEARKKHCKAWGQSCKKCMKLNHPAAACKIKKVVAAMETAPAPAVAALSAAPAAAAAAPAAGLNSVQVMPQIQPAYTFNPERFSEVTDGDGGVTDFWKLFTVIPVQTQRLWQGSGWSRLVTTVQV